MCDGIDNYFLSDLKSGIKSIYISNDGKSPMQKMLLPDFMHNNDVVLRVYGGRELSIITNEGLEFIYQENCWKLRDYVGIKKLIQKEIELTDNVFESILSYVIFCSKNDISSIIWIPKNHKKDELEKYLDSMNTLVKGDGIDITKETNSHLIMRMLSSDGACVITSKGTLYRYGCIIKMQNNSPNKVKGTGETAAANLAKNGIAFKISQDGPIKLFLDKDNLICL